MTTVTLNMFLTTALAVVVLYIGVALKKRFRVLQTFCIPAPVIGGLLFSLVSCALHVAGVLEFAMDETLKKLWADETELLEKAGALSLENIATQRIQAINSILKQYE